MKIIYEDKDIVVFDKPAGITTEDLLNKYPELKKVHRLDRETSGVLLTAKNDKARDFLQKQFKERKTEKKYIALVVGNPKNKTGVIETLIGRNPKNRKKQKVFLPGEPKSEGKRNAITKYKVLKNFQKYSLIEVSPITGRKHQIRCHFSYLGHPIVGDKVYGFKNQPCPEGLNRHFLHAIYLKIQLPNAEIKELKSKLPENLRKILNNLI